MKAAFKERPGLLFLFSAGFNLLAFTSLIRIFERPYYTFNFQHEHFHQFSDYMNALWYLTITMTSVGFGDIVAVTPVGRFVTLWASVVGAFYLAIMVVLVVNWLNLEPKQALCLHKIKDQNACGRSITAALQYNAARQKRYRLLTNGDEFNNGEYCPTMEDLNRLKDKMHRMTRIRGDCPEKQHHEEIAR